jgi:hypothetical protein
MNQPNDINEPSLASAGSHGIPLVVPALTLAGNFAGIRWNSCCRQHRAALNAAGIEWAEDMGPLEAAPDMQPTLTDEERGAIWTVAEAYAENDGDQECERIARIMQGLWHRTK